MAGAHRHIQCVARVGHVQQAELVVAPRDAVAVGAALDARPAIERRGVGDHEAPRVLRPRRRVGAVGAIVDRGHVPVAAEHDQPGRQAQRRDVIGDPRPFLGVRRPSVGGGFVGLRDPGYGVDPDDERRLARVREFRLQPLDLRLTQHRPRRSGPP